MKTFKQTVTESDSGDELYNLKISLGEWWKKHSKLTYLAKDKKALEKEFNTALRALDNAVDIVYEAEPDHLK